jgi:hypothetical protein
VSKGGDVKTFQRIVLVLIGLYHVGFAALATFSDSMARTLAKAAFGITLDGSPQVMYLAKVLGLYGLAFGGVALVAATDPVKYRRLISVILGLYVLRILERAVFLPLVRESFAISPQRIAVGCVLLGLFAVALFVTSAGNRQESA